MVSSLSKVQAATKNIMQHAGKLTHETVKGVSAGVAYINFYAGEALENGEITRELFDEYMAFADHIGQCVLEFRENNLIEVTQC